MIRIKKLQIFFADGTKKCRKRCKAGQKNLPEHPNKYENIPVKRKKNVHPQGKFMPENTETSAEKDCKKFKKLWERQEKFLSPIQEKA